MPKLYLGEALGLLGKTLPFVWVRLGSYLALFAALSVYFAVVGGLAWLLGRLWGPLGWIVFLAALGGGWGLVRWATRYYFYLLKAAHTAVMTEFIVHGQAPATGQLAYGRWSSPQGQGLSSKWGVRYPEAARKNEEPRTTLQTEA